MQFYHQSPRVARVSPTTKKFLDENKIQDLSQSLAFEFAPPASFSIKSSMSDVENQGQGATCCSFAVTAALEAVHGRIDLSEANLADVGSRTYHGCDPKSGLAIGEAMVLCQQQGIVEEKYWAYDESKVCWNPVPDVGADAHYKFAQIAVIFQRTTAAVIANMQSGLRHSFRETYEAVAMPGNFVNLIKACVFNTKVPVVLDVPVWFNSSGKFEAGWDFGPDIHMPTPAHLNTWLQVFGDGAKGGVADPPGIDGWHAIPICGFDDTTQRFEFKNSWNFYWGSLGYGTIPYEYITQYSRVGMVGIA